jgi:hypothetical protein
MRALAVSRRRRHTHLGNVARAELFDSIKLAAEIEALKTQLAEVMAGGHPVRPPECSNDR